MLLPPASRSSHSHRSTRFGRARRRIRKLATVSYILSGLCALAALIFVGISFFTAPGLRGKTVAHSQRVVSVAFIGTAPVLLLLGLGLNFWKHRFYGRGQRRHQHPEAASGDDGKTSGARVVAHATDSSTR